MASDPSRLRMRPVYYTAKSRRYGIQTRFTTIIANISVERAAIVLYNTLSNQNTLKPHNVFDFIS